jgi:cytochrome b6-f complex iron-sulfur subunit
MQDENNVHQPARRSFLNKLWVFLGGVALVEFVAVAVAFWRPRASTKRSPDVEAIVAAGAVENFAPNTVTAFVRGKFYLARLEDGGFLALSRKCTHLGCTLPWSDKTMRFACPCHGSAFAITGEIIDAPAPRALDIYPVRIENNIVMVDVRRAVQRRAFLREQVTYPQKKA